MSASLALAACGGGGGEPGTNGTTLQPRRSRFARRCRAGNPAQEGSGAVVALRPDDVARF
ncbi:hypothetical protein ACKFRZ_07730 [Corynebacterium gottingense]|uniref:hypothetical protein n=1 Tax=Corynebacterium gottingense TaxID=2041036 RepID=UPI0038CF4958